MKKHKPSGETNPETRQRLVSTARDMFLEHGISAVRMDDIAYQAGVSKKTLYLYFRNKEALVETAVTETLDAWGKNYKDICSDNNSGHKEKLTMLMLFSSEKYNRMKKPFVEDVKRFNPSVWKRIAKWRAELTSEALSGLIQDGIKQGIFRKDIDVALVLEAYIGMEHHLLSPEFIAAHEYSPAEINESLSKLFFEGLLAH